MLEGWLLLLGLLGLYLLPSVIAVHRNHRQAAPIALINIFLGWTLLGWLGALVWSVSYQPEKAT